MSATRRLAAGALAALALLAVASPASAAEPAVEWTRPTVTESVLAEPGPITGTIAGEEGQSIQGVSFDLVSDPPLDNPDDPCFVEPPNTNFVLDGNSTESFELAIDFPCNRAYELTATVNYQEPLVAVDVTKTTQSAPLRFSVAIPPAQVEGLEATYDEASKEVRLTWAPNSEADLLGYFVERNPPGREGFSRITPELLAPDATSFTDPGIEDEHRYRVIAVRRSAEALRELQGQPSAPVRSGPERSERTPADVPAPSSGAPSDSGTSGGSGSGDGSRRSGPPSRTRTTSNIFEGTLPFDPSQTTIAPPDPAPPPDSADAAVLAEFDDTSTDDDRRATLVPIAGGLALIVGAMHLLLLSKRAGEAPDIPMSSR